MVVGYFTVPVEGGLVVGWRHFFEEGLAEGVVLRGFVFGIAQGGTWPSWGIFGVLGHRRV